LVDVRSGVLDLLDLAAERRGARWEEHGAPLLRRDRNPRKELAAALEGSASTVN
jgi:hypothetical protein